MSIKHEPQDTPFKKWSYWLPTPGSAIFTLLIVLTLFWVNSAGAVRLLSSTTDEPALTNASSSTISYQGYLSDSSGNPVNDNVNIVFRLYNVESGGTAVWSESQSVAISDGLFSVLLGSQTPISTNLLAANDNLWLGIAVGTDEEMTPRDKIASAPFAMLANVADGSITQNHLANNSVTGSKIASGSVTQNHLANNAVTEAKIANGSITHDKLGNNAVGTAKLLDGAVTSRKTNLTYAQASTQSQVTFGTGATQVIDTSITLDAPGVIVVIWDIARMRTNSGGGTLRWAVSVSGGSPSGWMEHHHFGTTSWFAGSAVAVIPRPAGTYQISGHAWTQGVSGGEIQGMRLIAFVI